MDKPVKSITDDEIRAEIKKSLEKNKVKTVKNAWGLVKGVLKRQKREPPEIIFPPTVAEKLPYLKQKEIAAFLCALKGTPHELAALLALSSLRRSEIAALDWDKGSVEIKKDGVLIHVKGAVVHDEHNKLVEKSENKNATSRRTLRVEIPRLSELLINEPNKHGKVVRTSIHHYYDGINRVCRQIGLPNVGVHGLRRSFASLARKVNLSRKAVKEIGGWSDYKVVDKMYDQFDADERMEAENKLGEWFRDLKV